MNWKHAIVVIVLGALAAMAFYALRNHQEEEVVGTAQAMQTRVVDTITLKKTRLEKTLRLPGDLLPYEAVDIYAKVSGFIETINADRGTEAKQGDLLVQLIAPELNYRLGDARAQYYAAKDRYLRNLKVNVPAISPQEMETSKDAAESAFNHMHDLEEQIKYLTIRAPFDGVITTRYLHPGAFVIAGGATGAIPIFRIEMLTRLRLVAPVPEADVADVKEGVEVPFSVSAYPERMFTGKVARLSHSLALRTRTEPVELDVDNSNRLLAPGMYADIRWPMRRQNASFVVPMRAVVTTTEQVFVIRVKDMVAEWVDVDRGNAKGDSVEVFGALKEGDTIVADATDEIKPGEKLTAKPLQESISR